MSYCIITQVTKGKSADNAGIVPGDIIHSVNGVLVKHGSEVHQLLSDKPSGRSIVMIRRGGALQQFKINSFVLGAEIDDAGPQGVEAPHTMSSDTHPLQAVMAEPTSSSATTGNTFARSIACVGVFLSWILIGAGGLVLMSSIANTGMMMGLMFSLYLAGAGFFMLLNCYLALAILEMANSTLRSEQHLKTLVNQRN